MRRTMTWRLLFTAFMMASAGVYLLYRLFAIGMNRDYYMSFDLSAPREVTVICSYGDIYDRKGIKLVNREETYLAVIDPKNADKEALAPHITDHEKYDSCINGTALFLCEIDTPDVGTTTVIPVKERFGEEITAPHIIGYTGESGGVSGIELAYNDILRKPRSAVTLKYSVDARGSLLEGEGITMLWRTSYYTGVRTSLDAGIQRAAEAAMANVKKGAAVVMDIKTGELCAVVSKPEFDPAHPELSLDNEDSPFINRAFSAYSVGSCFKLVTAGAALEYGISEEYSYNCDGSIKIRTNDFDCHRFGGHGLLDMRKAMVESCNPYFISLAQDIPAEKLHDFAKNLGFGKASYLAEGITSQSGYLPAAKELLVPEEKANFAFGQGKLTATPLQVTMMTAAIANGGQMPTPVLIHGKTDEVHELAAASAPTAFTRIMKSTTADKLKSFMISTLYKENSAAVPEFVTGGGKTSTAQTWTYNENGTENVNCWFTGFFPANDPQYAVTVMIEEGVSGNLTCGPVFKEIADSVKLGRYADID